MRAKTLLILIAGGVVAGCASPQKIDQAAFRAEQRARECEARGDQFCADTEWQTAQQQREKANARRAQEAYYRNYYWW